jgi:ribosomal protein L14
MGNFNPAIAVFLIHELLYKLFAWELLWANIFLFLAFVVYAALLARRERGRGNLNGGFTARTALTRWSAQQARSAHWLRRQTRRTNVSIVRYRLLMVQRGTVCRIADHSGGAWIRVFHLYRGWQRRQTSYGEYIKGSLTKLAFLPKVIWGKRYKPLRVGFVVRGLVTQARFQRAFLDGARVSFRANAVILLKRRGTFKTTRLYGPACRLMGRKRYESLFRAHL